MGGECNDKTHFFCYNGHYGCYDLHQEIGAQELQFVALEREEARRDKDYAQSDVLRDWLIGHGCNIQDREHTMTLPDGGKGSYDLRNWRPFIEGYGCVPDGRRDGPPPR